MEFRRVEYILDFDRIVTTSLDGTVCLSEFSGKRKDYFYGHSRALHRLIAM